jgi:hypothetical protein
MINGSSVMDRHCEQFTELHVGGRRDTFGEIEFQRHVRAEFQLASTHRAIGCTSEQWSGTCHRRGAAERGAQ